MITGPLLENDLLPQHHDDKQLQIFRKKSKKSTKTKTTTTSFALLLAVGCWLLAVIHSFMQLLSPLFFFTFFPTALVVSAMSSSSSKVVRVTVYSDLA
jgi:hypothetical protein